jgi:hypothetical protein
MLGELLLFPHDIYGMVMNLNEDDVGAVLLGDDVKSKKATPSSGPAGSSKSRSAMAFGPGRFFLGLADR